MRPSLLLLLTFAPTMVLAQTAFRPPPGPPPISRYTNPIPDAVRGERAVEAFGVRFYFADEAAPRGREVAELTTGRLVDVTPYRRRDGGCRAAFQAALERLAGQAKAAGADTVVRINSDPVQPHASTPWSYLCEANGVELTGVAMARME